MVMFAIFDCMTAKHNKTALADARAALDKARPDLADALAELAEARPDLAERLGPDPRRAQLLEVLGDIRPDVAAGARQMPRPALVSTIAAIASKEKGEELEPLVTFTTRVPEGLAQAVKTRAITRGCSIQALVADYLRAGLAADDATE